jgi:NTE family protein
MSSEKQPVLPVEFIPAGREERRGAREGIALCLSGGGYRAMLFHLGALWRLNELGYLPRLAQVSSVSGGSITAGVLGMNWGRLGFESGVARDFDTQVVAPLRTMASVTIDQWSILGGIVEFGSINDKIAASYRKYLFGHRTLQDLPKDPENGPRFVINATNVQSGALWRFSRDYAGDWRVGRIPDPTIELAVAIAASSAFPPMLSPAHLDLEPGICHTDPGNDLHRPPFTTEVVLTDGGVYDNLGLETAWKSYRTVLVSDGGGLMAPEGDPPADWARHSRRILDLVDHQVRSLRKRALIDSFRLPEDHVNYRWGAYWGIRSDVERYSPPEGFPPEFPFRPELCPLTKTLKIANLATRLQVMDEDVQERLINWGYAISDVALRRHVNMSLPVPAGFPYARAL